MLTSRNVFLGPLLAADPRRNGWGWVRTELLDEGSPTMNWVLGDVGEGRGGVARGNGFGCGDGVGEVFVGFLDFSRPMSSCTRSTVKLIDSRPMLISRL